MLKTMLVAGAVCFGVMIAGPVGAARAADPDVDIGIGLGGSYDSGDSGPYYMPARRGISCREGWRIVASAGFRKVRPLDCHGTEFTYNGIRRDGVYKITLKSSNGHIKDVDRVHRWDSYGWSGDYGDDSEYADRGYGYGADGFGSGDYGAGFDDDVDF